MRILFMAPRLPLPADTGGKIRTWNILKEMARVHQCHLVCFSFSEGDRAYTSTIQALGVGLTLVPAREGALWQRVKGLLLTSQPYSAAKYDSPAMARAIRSLVNEQPFDAGHIDHIHMAHYLACLGDLPCVIDEHNVEYRILERCARVERSLAKRLIYRAQAGKMRRFEAERLEGCAAVTAVSSDDAQTLRDLIRKDVPVQVLPNGVDTGYFQGEAAHQEEQGTVVFTGSLDWLPNDDAVRYFCREVLPLVWQSRADLKFYIVGKNPSAEVLKLGAEEERLVITGRVDDVRPYLERAQIFVTPLRIGGGTRLKILEAMAMQKAVVSTSIGAEGICYSKGRDIAIADTPREFAGRILELLDAPSQRQAMGRAGRELVLRQYDWRVIGQELDRVYRELRNGKK